MLGLPRGRSPFRDDRPTHRRASSTPSRSAGATLMSWARGYEDQEVVDAMVKANRDRQLLAGLRIKGRVMRQDSPWSQRHTGFIRFIENLARPTRAINTAIRPKKGRRR